MDKIRGYAPRLASPDKACCALQRVSVSPVTSTLKYSCVDLKYQRRPVECILHHLRLVKMLTLHFDATLFVYDMYGLQ